MKAKELLIIAMLFISTFMKSQTIDNVVDNHLILVNYWNTVGPTKEAKFSKYIESNHGMNQNFTTWKKENKFLYIKEFWYYAESFYIKRNVNTEGITMDESQIDISRFEMNRKQTEESVINISGFKDVIVLLPLNKLIYKP
jgi:hypothetical protein